MSVAIKPLRKFTTGTPVLANMVEGEIAVNTADQKIFMRDDSNNIVTVGTAITAADDIAAGDSAINLTTTTGNITIDAQGSDTDIIFKGTDGSTDTTFLTIDGSDAGAATFNGNIITAAGIQTSSYFWQKTDNNATLYGGANFEVALTHVHNTGFKLTNAGTGTPAVELQFVDSNEAIGSDGTNLILTSGGTEFKIPTSDGSSGHVLQTNGSGTLSFAAASGNVSISESAPGSPSAGDLWWDSTDDDGNLKIYYIDGNSTAQWVATNPQIVTNPSGSNTQVQFNDGGSFGGDSGLTFNKSTNRLTAGSITISDAGTIGSASDPDAIAIGADGDVTLTQDLELQHDGAILSFGANDEIALTHVHNTGLALTDSGGTPTLQFHDSNESVSSDGTNLILTSGGTAFKIPTSDGSNGHVLQTNGSGTLSFAAASGGGGVSEAQAIAFAVALG